MEIEQTLQDVRVELSLTLNAPNEWGTDVMDEDPKFGEIYRDYFELENHITEMVEQGFVEVESVEDLHAAREKENVTFYIGNSDVREAI